MRIFMSIYILTQVPHILYSENAYNLDDKHHFAKQI